LRNKRLKRKLLRNRNNSPSMSSRKAIKKNKKKRMCRMKKLMIEVEEQSNNSNLILMKKKAPSLWKLRNSCKMVKKVASHLDNRMKLRVVSNLGRLGNNEQRSLMNSNKHIQSKELLEVLVIVEQAK
jgi:hypothetical protein